MLVTGPVALILVDEWRLAWGLFAVVTAAVTVWVAVVVPRGGQAASTDSQDDKPRVPTQGTAALILASFALGLSSIAVWTFGQDIVSTRSRAGWLAPVVWTVIRAAGIAGAFSGPVVSRRGIRTSWTVLMVTLAAGIAGLAGGAGVPVVALASGAVFGAAYIALTSVVLVWATRTYPTRPAFGVGLAFLMIAAGQAVGAPLVGLGSDAFSVPAVFYVCALVALASAYVPTPKPASPSTSQ